MTNRLGGGIIRKTFFYLGARTITKVRPSNLGLCSTKAISSVSSTILVSKALPSSESVISRPLKITETLTLSFLPINFFM
jgi:hypothetical protein